MTSTHDTPPRRSRRTPTRVAAAVAAATFALGAAACSDDDDDDVDLDDPVETIGDQLEDVEDTLLDDGGEDE